MALTWDWNKRIGTIELTDQANPEEKHELRLYQGNALLIVLEENDEKKTFFLHRFFADEVHAKRCLGLAKGYDECFAFPGYDMVVNLDGNYDVCTKLAKLFKQAGIHFNLRF